MLIDGVDMLPGRAEYPRNQWYVAALGFEVTQEPLHRMLFGDPVVLFRTEAGDPVALFDRCPHRGMRLSNGGKVIGDTIQCNYHGIRFGVSGRACLVPSGGVATSALSVRRYPLAEVGGWIWAWAGDPALADADLIPDHTILGLNADGFHAYYGLVLEGQSNYLYSFENLVDATHITFLHHGLIDSGNVAAHPYICTEDGKRVSMLREFHGETVAPMVQRGMQLRGNKADRTLELISYAPNICVVRQLFTETEFADAPPRELRLIFGITPAGPKACYQFVAIAQTYENMHPALFEDLRHLLMEDVIALNDIQLLFDALEPDRVPEVSVRADEGAIRSRRLIARMIADERAVQSAHAA